MFDLDRYKNRVKEYNVDVNLVDYLYKCLSDEDRLGEFDKCIDMLIKGVPIQYVIGNVNFYGNKILVNSNVLIPRFETELLVEKSIKYIKKLFDKCIRIVDIGTGSGCIAITLKKEINCEVVGVDISNDAIEVARENARINNVDIEFVNSDMLKNVSGIYDVIISNPPYIRYDEEIMGIVRDNEPSIALYAMDNGLYYYKEILSNCIKVLNSKYLICFEIGYEQGDSIKELVYKYLKDVNVSIEKDYSDRDRFVFIWN